MKKIHIPDNLTTLAYKRIRDYILDGRLDEETRLTEESIARRLGISKSPVREALTKLESEGLIRIEPRRGAYLPVFSLKDVSDLYDLREALEGHAVSTANVDARTLAVLRESIDRMRSSLDRGSKAAYIDEDVRFHTLLAGAAGNNRLADLLERVQLQAWLFRRKTYTLSRACAIPEHRAIVEALAERDGAKAGQLMREHICNVRQRLLACVSEQGSPRTRAAGVSV